MVHPAGRARLRLYRHPDPAPGAGRALAAALPWRILEPSRADGSRPPWEQALRRHQLTAQAVYHRLGGRAVLSHQSAVAIHGLPVWGLDLDTVHLTRLSGCARADQGVQQHRVRLDPAEIVERSGTRLTTVTRSVLDAACLCEYQAAVSVIDAALNRQLTTRAELEAALVALRRRTGVGTAANAVAFADGGAESVGESRLRVVMADQGLPTPALQAKIVAPDGELVARVDFLFASHRVVVEFDGAAKYGDDGATVVAEKWREDRIRELGYIVVRVSWDDLDRPRLIAQRIRAAFALAAKLA